MAANKAAKNKAIRQEALREQLTNGGHLQHVIDIAKQLNEGHLSLESSAIQALRASADIKLKLINKYLPDLKSMELTGEGGGPMKVEGKVEWSIQPVKALNES